MQILFSSGLLNKNKIPGLERTIWKIPGESIDYTPTSENVLLSVWICADGLNMPSSPLLTISMRTGKQFSRLVLHANEKL